ATPHVAVHVQSLDRSLVLFAIAEEPAERGRFARHSAHVEPLFQPGESGGERLLRRVARDFSASHKGRVLVADGSRHVANGMWLEGGCEALAPFYRLLQGACSRRCRRAACATRTSRRTHVQVKPKMPFAARAGDS